MDVKVAEWCPRMSKAGGREGKTFPMPVVLLSWNDRHLATLASHQTSGVFLR
jgi:hypothetical protein